MNKATLLLQTFCPYITFKGSFGKPYNPSRGMFSFQFFLRVVDALKLFEKLSIISGLLWEFYAKKFDILNDLLEHLECLLQNYMNVIPFLCREGRGMILSSWEYYFLVDFLISYLKCIDVLFEFFFFC